MLRFLKLIIYLSLMMHLTVFASHQPALALDKYFYQAWNTSDGLPHNSINALNQSSDGYMWLATWEGLVRFNGQTFTTYERDSTTGLPDSAVKSLFATDDGRLLVAGARGGVSERNNGFWRPLARAKTLVNHAIYDSKQGIWLGMEEGLYYRKHLAKADISVIEGVRVYQIVEDHHQILWAATDQGLFSVKNTNEITQYPLTENNHDGVVYSVILNSDNQVMIGTSNGAFKLVNGKFKSLNEKLNHSSIFRLYLDSNNDIWVGTTKKGLFRISDTGIERLNDNSGLPNNRILSIFEDKEHSIWVGTSGGLFRLREAPFVTITTKQGLAGNYVRAVLADSDGRLWVGTSKGLSLIDHDVISTVSKVNDSNPLSVLSLTEGINQQILVGSYTQGVFRIIDERLTAYKQLNQHLVSQEVRSLLMDSKQNLWVGTTSGVVMLSPEGAIKHFDLSNGLPANFIMALAEDARGRIWIGTGNGVVTYFEGQLKNYHLKDQFDAEYAFGFQPMENAMWLATDRGILRIDSATDEIKAITRSNGLPIDKFFQIVVDDKNIFWLTSNRGIVKINGDEINRILEDQNGTIEYELFTEESGLVSSQANGGSTPAATLHQDGSIWVATAKGVSQVTHDRLIKRSQQTLPIAIEQLIVDGIEYQLPTAQSITLPAGTAHIAIYYAGLGYLNSEHILYQTRLIGFDKHWNDKSSQIYTEFTNLGPGYYRFMMRAKYPDSKWHQDVAVVGFTIEPYFWQTLWFKIFCAFMVLAILYLGYRYRLIKIKNNEKRLEQLVEKQTLELKQQAQSFAYQATHDQLTGLPNRRAFDSWCVDDFKKASSEQHNLSLAVMDIDHFKRVNDGYSHLVGDKVIKVVANILLVALDDCQFSVKLARWGGEEFTLLVQADQEQAFVLCEMIRMKVAMYDFSSIAPGLKVTISCGLTDNATALDYDNMLKLADHALYFAKHHGRNLVKIYQPNIDYRTGINQKNSQRRRSDCEQ